MKKNIFLSFLTIAFLAAAPAMAKENLIDVKVNGVVCALCAQGIKKNFGKEDSIEKVDVNLDEMMVYLTTKEGMSISDERIQEIITDAGFELVEVTRDAAPKE